MGGSDITEVLDAEILKEELGCLDTCQHLAEGQFLTTINVPPLIRLLKTVRVKLEEQS